MTKLEKLILSKIVFVNKPKTNCEQAFNRMVEIPFEERFKTSKRLVIEKNEKGVTYDSPYEKKILEELDHCTFIKRIKTQSLIIEYHSNSSKKTKKYYPDLQLLLEDGKLAIIEVKPFKEMVNKHNMIKYEELVKYCKKHGYGYSMIDHDYYSFEDIKKEKVSWLTQYRFIFYVKRKKEVTFEECDDFKKRYNLNDYQICHIIWKNRNKHLKYQQHTIMYE